MFRHLPWNQIPLMSLDDGSMSSVDKRSEIRSLSRPGLALEARSRGMEPLEACSGPCFDQSNGNCDVTTPCMRDLANLVILRLSLEQALRPSLRCLKSCLAVLRYAELDSLDI